MLLAVRFPRPSVPNRALLQLLIIGISCSSSERNLLSEAKADFGCSGVKCRFFFSLKSVKSLFNVVSPSLSLSVQKKNDYCLEVLSTSGKVNPLTECASAGEAEMMDESHFTE